MKDNKTKMRAVMQKCVWSLSTLGAVIGIAIATLSISPANVQGTQNLQFDVFIDANTIYFGGPAGPNPGTTFIVTGYIYPGAPLQGILKQPRRIRLGSGPAVERSRAMLLNSVPRSSPFRNFTCPMTPPPSQRKVLSMAWWEWTTVTCVPPLAVRAFIRTSRDKTQNTGSASTEPAYSISRSHSPTRSGHKAWSETCTREIASRRTGSAPRCRHPSAATASKLLLGNHSLL